MKRFKYHESSRPQDLGRMALKTVCASEGVYMTRATDSVKRKAQFSFFMSSTKKMTMSQLRRDVTPGLVAAFKNFRTQQEK